MPDRADIKRERERSRYRENHDAQLARVKAYRHANATHVNGIRLANRRQKQEVINSLKSVPCADCGMSYPPYVMDFDHVRGEKLFTIARALSNQLSLDSIRAEIAKCEVVCSNCHRIRTHKGRKPWSF